MSELSVERLAAIARQYYPPGISLLDERYHKSHGSRRLAVYHRGSPRVALAAISVYAPIYFLYCVRMKFRPPFVHEVLVEGLPTEAKAVAGMLASAVEELYGYTQLLPELACVVVMH